jgi:hypothetical protein
MVRDNLKSWYTAGLRLQSQMTVGLKNIFQDSRGSFTVEAIIIFSVIFLLLAAMVYAFIIMYQYTFLQSVVNQTANTAAIYYVNEYGKTGEDYIKLNTNLYWRFLDKEADSKKNNINNYISNCLDRSILHSTKSIYNDTSYKFLIKQINISVEDKYPLPIGNMFKIFGISSTLNLKAQTNSPLDDNAEFIRNLDIVIDVKNCISNSDNKWIGEGTKVNEIIDKLFKKD